MTTIKYQRGGGETVDEITWTPEELQIKEMPNGPAMAAILAAGIGVLALGILTVLSEANTDVHDFLDFKSRVGPLSGKTTLAVVAQVVAWALLAPVMWKRNVPANTVFLIAAILIAAGLIGTFPEFFQEFA